jgi:hypothetical protein
MSWRISDREFLIQGRSYPIYLSLSVGRVRLLDGTLINSAHEYFKVSADGSVLEWYRGPSTSTLEECLYVINIHSVLQTSLSEFFWTECYGRAGEIQEKLILRGLEPLAKDAIPFDPTRIVETFHRDRTGETTGDK